MRNIKLAKNSIIEWFNDLLKNNANATMDFGYIAANIR